MGEWLPADALSRGEVPLGERSSVVSVEPGRARCRRAGRRFLDDLAVLNRSRLSETGDPEINTRIAQYELAFRMQSAVPDRLRSRTRPQHVFDMYGPESKTPGTFAANCLLARRLAERGVRFIQLFHRGWDQHTKLPTQIAGQCRDTDQASAALVADLKQRGLLDDTLVVWGGEFGRTVYCQGTLTAKDYGRDHHPRCFTIWLAGGGQTARVRHWERPTTTATTSRKIRYTCMTCTRRSCTAWASIIPG